MSVPPSKEEELARAAVRKEGGVMSLEPGCGRRLMFGGYRCGQRPFIADAVVRLLNPGPLLCDLCRWALESVAQKPRESPRRSRGGGS
jgi:hypothetical protein